jgi:hypothetical protein
MYKVWFRNLELKAELWLLTAELLALSWSTKEFSQPIWGWQLLSKCYDNGSEAAQPNSSENWKFSFSLKDFNPEVQMVSRHIW